MKKFLIAIFTFFFVFICIDYVFGCFCRYLQTKAIYGNNHDVFHVANSCTEDIIFMGSSRCHHHYIPQIVTDSLGMTSFNAGYDGNGIIYQYGLLQLMLRNHIPKVIVYDFYPNFDISINDNLKYINTLKPYAKERCLLELLNDVNPMEKFKTLSSFYSFNTNFVQLYKDTRFPSVKTYNGYLPNNEVMDYLPTVNVAHYTTDSLKYKYLEKFAQSCKDNNIHLIFVFSPFYQTLRWSDTKFLEDFCKQHNLLLLDYYSEGYLKDQKQLWKDPTHLNDTGAHVFSSHFAHVLKKILENESTSN